MTILVNGLPLIHIELKRRGIALREAFNQIRRYQRDSFWASHGFFEYVQLFVISNGTHTKYYSNTTRDAHVREHLSSTRAKSKKTSNSFEFTSFWADGNNKNIPDLVDFTKTFFAKHAILNILTKYCVFTSEDLLLVMRPYQIAATEKILSRIKISTSYRTTGTREAGGYIWHTTGTGKTFMAFQIIYKLWKAGIKKKILFLADRNVLIDQTITGDFKPFEGKMTKIQDRTLDSSYEIFLGLYHQLTGEEGEEAFRQLKENFFDLIVIDECHRGSAKEDSEWRRILDYFSSATHLGLTATPVETKEASSQSYFGKPIYEYSLKQGIDDGFLAPYKVIRINLDKDIEGYRPEAGKRDRYGYEIEDREYNIKDYDRKLVIDDRTRVVANKISEYLKNTDRFSKTIVFCVDIEHAERMRQVLINENKDLYVGNNKYIMRITGDNAEGKAQLDYFIDEESRYPVIAVTSKLMTTGVDAKMCKLIVLENNINSMTEFKQIIGRGTRLLEEHGKTYFTIMDFRNSSRLFADPAFDGQPEVVIDLGEDEPVIDPEVEETSIYEDEPNKEIPLFNDGGDPGFIEDFDDKPKKYYVGDVEVRVLSERVQYMDKNGKLITESLVDYTKKNIINQFTSLDQFLKTWTESEKKQAIIDELSKEGVILEAIREEIDMDTNEIDDFDLICHLAYDKAPLTRAERVNNVKKRHYLYKYSGLAQEVLEALLDKYANEGIKEIEETQVLELTDFRKFGNPLKIVKAFGGAEAYRQAIQELGKEIYA